jgi:hypothetical protein
MRYTPSTTMNLLWSPAFLRRFMSSFLIFSSTPLRLCASLCRNVLTLERESVAPVVRLS